MDFSEPSVVIRCRNGDSEAWESLFESYYPPVCRFVAQLDPSFSREDVEEVAQETFLAVVKGLSGFQASSQFLTWVYRIATNKARDHRDKRLAAKRGGGVPPASLDAPVPGSDSPLPAINPASPLPRPDQELIKREQMELLMEGLGRLGEPCREIIELRYFGDLSYEEIGVALELNEKTVSSRLSRCLDSLENAVQELCGNPPRTEAGQSGIVSV